MALLSLIVGRLLPGPSLPTEPPIPEQSSADDPRHLRVVSMLEGGGVLERIRGGADRLVAEFDPIVDLQRGVIAGYEVLLSLDGSVPASPRDWSQAAHVQHAGRIESRLVATALRARDRMPEQALLVLAVSTQALVTEEVAAALTEAGRLDRVVIAVADDAGAEEAVGVTPALQAARDAGASIAVDETGSGYAPLRHVLRLRPDYVRIGGELVEEIDRDQAKAAVVETFGALASRIDACILAGAISGSPELGALRRLGIPFGQGPLFGGPSRDAGPLTDEARRALADSTPAPADKDTVAELVEARPALSWSATLEDLADAFLDDPRHDVVILVDERHRPLALAERAALLRGEPYERPITRITPSSPLRAVARRAASRPMLERYHPLVVCDRSGVYQGIVRVEQLLDALARD